MTGVPPCETLGPSVSAGGVHARLSFSRTLATPLGNFHMNEGHAALLALELFDEELKPTLDKRNEAIERVKRMCVFITHTPVPAGRDQFFLGVAEQFDRRPVGGLAGFGVLQRDPQHDVCETASKLLCQRCDQKTARGVALDVLRLSDQRDHQRRVRGYLDRPRISAALRPLYPAPETGQLLPALRPWGPPRGYSPGPSGGETAPGHGGKSPVLQYRVSSNGVGIRSLPDFLGIAIAVQHGYLGIPIDLMAIRAGPSLTPPLLCPRSCVEPYNPNKKQTKCRGVTQGYFPPQAGGVRCG